MEIDEYTVSTQSEKKTNLYMELFSLSAPDGVGIYVVPVLKTIQEMTYK